MPGSAGSMHRRRAKGSWGPRLAGIAAIVAVAGGGVAYLNISHHGTAPKRHGTTPASHPTTSQLSTTVVSHQTVGLIGFGVYDDHDSQINDADDHPVMLQPSGTSVNFVFVPTAQITTGQPTWTVNQMGDGTDIFTYIPTGSCLGVAPGGQSLKLEHCQLELGERWRPAHQTSYFQQAISAFVNVQTGTCLTAPRRPGAAYLSSCGPLRTKRQEIAFFWTGI